MSTDEGMVERAIERALARLGWAMVMSRMVTLCCVLWIGVVVVDVTTIIANALTR